MLVVVVVVVAVTHEDAAFPPPVYLAELASQAEDEALHGMEPTKYLEVSIYILPKNRVDVEICVLLFQC